MPSGQISFTDVEYWNRRRVSRREQFLGTMDATIPWSRWVGLIGPFTCSGSRGRKPKALETMLRMYLLQAWFSLSDEGVEDAIDDSYAMRRFLGLDFTVEQVPDATTLLHFRHLLEKHQLGRKLLESQGEIFEGQGWIMRGGGIVDATIIAAPSAVMNASGARDPQMRQALKGNQWNFGMKAHIGVDAGAGYVHSVTATAASVHDLDQVTHLVRADDEVVYADAGLPGSREAPPRRRRPAPVAGRVPDRGTQVETDCDGRPRPRGGVAQGISAGQDRAPGVARPSSHSRVIARGICRFPHWA